jgi:hypothetical protein
MVSAERKRARRFHKIKLFTCLTHGLVLRHFINGDGTLEKGIARTHVHRTKIIRGTEAIDFF